MRIYIILIVLFLAACGKTANESLPEEQPDPAQTVIEKAIEVSGGEKYLNSTIRFDFRDRSYVGTRKNGLFIYERLFTDSLGNYHDILDNKGFTRRLNDQDIDVVDSMAQKYTNSVNSVLYFALLPYGLNDPAVIKEYLGETEIGEKRYHKVKITFMQEGGGVDYQDVFVYWVNMENHFIDYFGYTYETDGGGKRFREAYDPQIVNGIRFQNYINYEPKEGDTTDITQFDSLYVSGQLDTLSLIELEQIEVELDPSI